MDDQHEFIARDLTIAALHVSNVNQSKDYKPEEIGAFVAKTYATILASVQKTQTPAYNIYLSSSRRGTTRRRQTPKPKTTNR